MKKDPSILTTQSGESASVIWYDHKPDKRRNGIGSKELSSKAEAVEPLGK
jgi:hypothetical protein